MARRGPAVKDFRDDTDAAMYIERGRDRPTGRDDIRRQGSRGRGTNPRAKQTNPRRLGTNPSAAQTADIARVGRLRRRALARWRAGGNGAWCELCYDTGLVTLAQGWPTCEGGDDGRTFYPCPNHRQITANEAADIIEGER